MDINKLAVSRDLTYRLVIEKVNGEEAGFILKGKTSPEYEAATREISVQNIMFFAANKVTPDPSTREGAEMATVNADRVRMEVARACTVDWFGMTSNGDTLEFNQDSLKELLEKNRWLVEKIFAAVEDEANFTQS